MNVKEEEELQRLCSCVTTAEPSEASGVQREF
jgi:hypothetical protein